jgi:mannosyltransferase
LLVEGLATRDRSGPGNRVDVEQRTDLSLVLGLASLTLGAAVLRWPTLAGGSLWFDEWFTRRIVSGSLVDVARYVKGTESTPPLYYGVAWLWSNVFGTGDVALRSLSVVFGTTAVPVAFFTASTLASRRAGWVAATLVATNPLLVWYSTEARAYSLLVFLSAVSLLFVARALTRPTPGTLRLWSVTAALALATHYFAAFLIVGEVAVLLGSLPSRRRAVMSACVPIGVVGILLAPLAYLQRGHGSWIDTSPLASRVEEVGRNLISGVSIANVALEFLAAAFVVALILLALTGSTGERRAAWAMLAVGTISLVIPLVLALAGSDYLITRNVIASVLPFALVASIGGASRHFGRIGYALAGSLAAVSLVNIVLIASDDRLQRVEWKHAAQLLGEPRRDRLVIAWGDYRLAPLGELLQPAARVGKTNIVEVSQIDILVFERPSGRISCWSGAACNMVPIAKPANTPSTGFSFQERREDGLFEVYRFTATGPRRVSIGRIIAPLAVPFTPYVWRQTAATP